MTTVVKPDGGTMYESRGDAMRFILSDVATNGQYTLIEDSIKPGFNLGLHLHRRHSETFYILSGAITFTLGNERVLAESGTTIHIPPNTLHAVQADQPCKLLTWFSPAVLEGAMKAFAARSPEQANDPAVNRAIMAQYDIVDVAQPPVPMLIRLYDLLLAGDETTLRALFAGEPNIDTPLNGAVHGESAFAQFVRDQQTWLTARQAKVRFVNAVVTEERIVIELLLDLQQDGPFFDLPVVFAADRALNAEGKITAIRVYHSTWPLNGKHAIRGPLVQPPAKELREPALMTAYIASLRDPNKPLILSLFADDAYVREPSGTQYRHDGVAGRKEFYDMALDQGGVMLQHCLITFDGYSFAVEYICDEWANKKIPPQCGLAVYDFASEDKIQAARIYDDVTSPEEM